MTPAADAREFLSSPVGTYLVGASCVVWAESRERIGMFHLGRFEHADRAVLEQIFPIVTSPALAERYDLLHDIGAVSQFDEPTFQFFGTFLAAWVPQLTTRIRRLGVVRPSGLAGAAFTGLFHEWVVSRFDAQLCETRASAYEFLSVPDPVRATLDRVAAAGTSDPRLRQLRGVLEANLLGASLETAAAAMATSTRSLQRALTAHGTSFRKELVDARIRTAQRLLLERDDKVETIASAIGLESAAAFSTLFRREVGDTPSEYRERFGRGRRG